MPRIRTLSLTVFILLLLAACDSGPASTPTAQTTGQATGQPTGQPTSAVQPQIATPPPATTTATSVPVLKPGSLFPAGLSNEPLTVVTTSPADKASDTPVGKELARIIVQFNHPVVPLVSVDAQKGLPQPLSIAPAVQGSGEWINTSTYAFTPAVDLTPAESYSVSVKTLTDMLGQSLAGYGFRFNTSAPAVTKTFPENNTVFAGPSQPITITFNTAMDSASVESRFSLKRMISPATNEFGPALSGKSDWQGVVMRFTPDQPLEYDANYIAQVGAGAQDAKKQAASKANANWTFRTVHKPEVVFTTPRDGESSSKELRRHVASRQAAAGRLS